jgi:hypothetical protein
MIQLIYVSSAIKPFENGELVELLTRAREKNSRLKITGMLLYKGGNFMQVLEGEEAPVRALFDTIHADPRHRGTLVMLEEEVEQRVFGDWSMAFRNLADPEVWNLDGFSPFMNNSLNAQEFKQDPTGCMGLLKLFSQGR